MGVSSLLEMIALISMVNALNQPTYQAAKQFFCFNSRRLSMTDRRLKNSRRLEFLIVEFLLGNF